MPKQRWSEPSHWSSSESSHGSNATTHKHNTAQRTNECKRWRKPTVCLRLVPDRKRVPVPAAHTNPRRNNSPMANRQKATVQVKVKILNPDDYLRPEENANVRFIADEKSRSSPTVSSGAVVPISAIHDNGGKRVVMVAFNSRAVTREVKVIS